MPRNFRGGRLFHLQEAAASMRPRQMPRNFKYGDVAFADEKKLQ